MKILFLILFTSATRATTDVEKFLSPNAVMRQLFEIFRNAIKNGSKENNVPVLDPFVNLQNEFNIDHPNMRLFANLTNSVYSGLGDFQLKKIFFLKEELAVDLTLLFPKLIMESDNYQMKGYIFGLPLFGQGRLRFEVKDLEIKSKIHLTLSENGIATLIEKFENPQFSVRKILSNTEFDENIDCIINKIVKDVLATYITRFNKYIIHTYSETIKHFINVFLDRFDTWRIISSLL
ncbi:unnamed protein product [Pieris macdunnoughi]|uniref:Uncharacterized protein n=1 Tax=Pieris macdunnoughi TaxID=345717 RepID=A0A821U5B3_9NEOP|nr:unnamed protein product [Pieris macdunnoughi]